MTTALRCRPRAESVRHNQAELTTEKDPGAIDIGDRLAEIRSLRRRGVLSAKEAYERHVALLGAYAAPPAPPQPAGEAEGAPSEGAAGWRRAGLHALAATLALLGGVLGLIVAAFQELRSFDVLIVFAGGPLIEEALKPAGVYVLLLRWPQALLGRLHTALLTALGGLAFGLVESLVYVNIYFPDNGAGYELFRFTVPVLMHVLSSFLVGLGLTRSVIGWAAGREALPKAARNYYLAGVLLHAFYNVTAVILEASGELRFGVDG